jgi:NADH-quinone oxidoreductase subunit C
MLPTTYMNLNEVFKAVTPLHAIDCPTYQCPPEQLFEVMSWLRNEQGYCMLLDVTAVDNGVDASPRFTGVYHVLSMKAKVYLRLRVDALSDSEPELPSVAAIYPAANWHERETFDLMGIRYSGHPDLRRILMWDGYPHHPLRKDFPLAGIEETYPEEDIVEHTGLTVQPAPMAGGPFVAAPSGPMSEKEPRALDESWRETNPKA